MKTIITHKALLIFLLLSLSWVNCSLAQEQSIELTIKDIVEDGWNKDLSILQELFPGGIHHAGDIKKREAETYRASVLIADLNTKAHITFHKPVGQSQLETDNSLPVKDVKFQLKNSDQTQTLLDSLKDILASTFPNGGPINRDSKQSGYFIPNHKNCGDIRINWSTRQARKEEILSVVLQCH